MFSLHAVRMCQTDLNQAKQLEEQQVPLLDDDIDWNSALHRTITIVVLSCGTPNNDVRKLLH